MCQKKYRNRRRQVVHTPAKAPEKSDGRVNVLTTTRKQRKDAR